jgi:hypothetical protein
MDLARRCRSDRIKNTALRVTLCLPELKPVDLLSERRNVYLVQNILLAGSPQYLGNYEEENYHPEADRKLSRVSFWGVKIVRYRYPIQQKHTTAPQTRKQEEFSRQSTKKKD